MHYKVLKNSGIGEQLTKHQLDKRKAETDIKDYIKEKEEQFGVSIDKFRMGFYSIFGGVSAIKLDMKPEGWKYYGSQRQGFVTPKVGNKEENERLSQLTEISPDQRNNIIGFEQEFLSTNNGIGHLKTYDIKDGGDFHLITTHQNSKYTPIKGVEPIDEDEYNSLLNE